MAMDSAKKRRLQSVYADLLDNIADIDPIIDELFSKEVLTKTLRDMVNEKTGATNKLRELLDILPRRGDKAFDVFYNALVKCGETVAADFLCPERAEERQQQENKPVDVKITGKPVDVKITPKPVEPVEDLPSTWPDQDYHPFKFEVTSVKDSSMKDAFKTGKDITGKTVYPLKKSKRGVCLIISNETFEAGLEKRNTADDLLAISRLFQELEFNVQPRKNLTSDGMVEAVRTQAENIKTDKKDNDCFVCVILSHGTGANHGHIYGTDGKLVPLEKLQAEVDGANCPPLSGKPKIFIVQACGTAVGATKISAPAEGEAGAVPTTGLEAGMKNVSLEGKGDAPDASKIENPGSKSDFFTISANVPDMMTGVESGTLFIQTLACVFAKCCHNNDINALVTKVIKLAQKTNISEVVCDTKSSLTQSLYFFPGLNDEELILF